MQHVVSTLSQCRDADPGQTETGRALETSFPKGPDTFLLFACLLLLSFENHCCHYILTVIAIMTCGALIVIGLALISILTAITRTMFVATRCCCYYHNDSFLFLLTNLIPIFLMDMVFKPEVLDVRYFEPMDARVLEPLAVQRSRESSQGMLTDQRGCGSRRDVTRHLSLANRAEGTLKHGPKSSRQETLGSCHMGGCQIYGPFWGP